MTTLSERMRILIMVLSIAILIWGLIVILPILILGPKPPRPEITHGEFDFRLEYEVHCERFIIEDTLVVQFTGFSANTGSMAWFRTWSLHVASDSRSRNILIHELEDGRRIYYVPEGANYLMGDLRRERVPNPHWYPFNGVTMEYPPNMTREIGARTIGRPENLFDMYGIRIISWERDPPIENRFE